MDSSCSEGNYNNGTYNLEATFVDPTRHSKHQCVINKKGIRRQNYGVIPSIQEPSTPTGPVPRQHNNEQYHPIDTQAEACMDQGDQKSWFTLSPI